MKQNVWNVVDSVTFRLTQTQKTRVYAAKIKDAYYRYSFIFFFLLIYLYLFSFPFIPLTRKIVKS